MGDPFSRGAYSFAAVGATPKDYATLAAPVSGTLFFAGEHTNGTHMATAHGALASGLRAAAEVSALYAGKLGGTCPKPLVKQMGAGASGSSGSDSPPTGNSDDSASPSAVSVNGAAALRLPVALCLLATVAAILCAGG